MAELTFDKTAIVNKGGQKWAYMRVDEDGASLSQPDSWHDGVYREKSDIEFKQTEKGIFDESGAQVATEKDNMEVSLSITSLQDDAALINFLKDEVEDTYFAIFMERGEIGDNKKQEVFFPITKIERSYKSSAPGRRPEIKIIPLENATAVSPASGVPTWAEGTSGSFSVGAGEYFKVVESTIS